MKLSSFLLFFFFSFGTFFFGNAQDFWQPLNGPSGLSVRAMETDIAGNIYINSRYDGLLRSVNGGDSWGTFTQGLGPVSSFTLKFLPSPDGQMYILNDEKLYHLNDDQTGWQQIPTPLAGQGGIDLAHVTPNGDIFIVSSNATIYISTDQGGSFNLILTNDQTEGWAQEFYSFGNNLNFFFSAYGASGRFYRFNDDGSNLQLLMSGSGADFDNFFFDESHNTLLYSRNYQLFISSDIGENWNEVIIDPNLTTQPSVHNFFVHTDGNLYVMTYDGFLKSEDGGFSWVYEDLFNTPTAAVSSTSIKFINDNTILWSASGCNREALFRSQDGGENWDDLSTNFKTSTTFSITKDHYQNLFARTCKDTYLTHSSDDGTTWFDYTIGSEELKVTAVAFNSFNHYFAVAEDNNIYRSMDNGNSWENLNTGSNPPQQSIFISPSNEIFVTSLVELLKSSDNGETWESLPTGLLIQNPNHFTFHPNGDIYYTNFFNSLSKSSDGGYNWTEIPLLSDIFETYAFHITSKGTIFLYGGDFIFLEPALYVSHDEGLSFQPVSINDSSLAIYAFTSNIEGHLFCATNDGIYLTKDNGLTWTLNDESTNIDSRVLFMDSEQYLYAGTRGDVIYKSSKATVEVNTIHGNVWQEENDDCLFNNEPSLRNWIVEAEGTSSFYNSTGYDGNFRISVPNGDYTVNLIPPNDLWATCFTDEAASFDDIIDSLHVDMPAKVTLLCAYLNVDISTPLLRRCFDNNYTVQYCNKGTATAEDAFVEITLDPFFEFISSEISPTSNDGNVYTFPLGTVEPGDCRSFKITVNVSCEADLGQLHCIEAHLFPDFLCLPTLDSLFLSTECRENIGSFDPNDKTAFVNGQSTYETVLPTNKFIDYHIRFQNTGTDTAFQVIVEDTLSSFLDPASIIPGASSHTYRFELSGQGVVKFIFENIILPDSTINESASHGFVKFRVSQRENLPIGTEIHNFANIYFDFNDAVKTNTSMLTVDELDAVKNNNSSSIATTTTSPNPFKTYTIFNISNTKKANFKLQLIDINGRLVRTENFETLAYRFYREGLFSGIYFYKISDENGFSIGNGKIIVE